MISTIQESTQDADEKSWACHDEENNVEGVTVSSRQVAPLYPAFIYVIRPLCGEESLIIREKRFDRLKGDPQSTGHIIPGKRYAGETTSSPATNQVNNPQRRQDPRG